MRSGNNTSDNNSSSSSKGSKGSNHGVAFFVSPTLPSGAVAAAPAVAGARWPPALSRDGGEGGGGRGEGEGVGGGEALEPPPPPVWQEARPDEDAVVTEADLQGFQHFWLANEEHKLLMVAIPKVGAYL